MAGPVDDVIWGGDRAFTIRTLVGLSTVVHLSTIRSAPAHRQHDARLHGGGMLELVGLMSLSAFLVVTGNALRDRPAGRVLVIGGVGTAALVIALIALTAARLVAALAND